MQHSSTAVLLLKARLHFKLWHKRKLLLFSCMPSQSCHGRKPAVITTAMTYASLQNRFEMTSTQALESRDLCKARSARI